MYTEITVDLGHRSLHDINREGQWVVQQAGNGQKVLLHDATSCPDRSDPHDVAIAVTAEMADTLRETGFFLHDVGEPNFVTCFVIRLRD